MRNLFFVFIFLIGSNFSFSQAISYRYMHPKKGQGQDLMKGLEMKTKKYNSKESDPRIYTFQSISLDYSFAKLWPNITPIAQISLPFKQ